jgi:hypothetical protein
MHVTFPAHFAIGLVTLAMFSEEYNSADFSRHMSSHLGLNTFLIIIFSNPQLQNGVIKIIINLGCQSTNKIM